MYRTTRGPTEAVSLHRAVIRAWLSGLGTEIRRTPCGTLIALVVRSPLGGHITVTPSIYATPGECAQIYSVVVGRLCA